MPFVSTNVPVPARTPAPKPAFDLAAPEKLATATLALG